MQVTFSLNQRGVHDDQHALWIDPKDGRHQIIGCDGGFYVTYDRCQNWDHMNQMALGQFYHVAVDSKKPYFVYGGLQDNGCWGVPSLSLRGPGPVNEDVIPINGGDGYVCRVDQEDPDQVYGESQNGGMVRYNLKTGEKGSIKTQPAQGVRYRFNWNTPHPVRDELAPCTAAALLQVMKRGSAKIISLEHAEAVRPRLSPNRLATGRPLGRHRRWLPLDHEERRQGLDQHHGESRPEEADLGRDDRNLTLRRRPGLRGLRRSPHGRRFALPLHDGRFR